MSMRTIFFPLMLILSTPAWGADVPVPVATDSRIKTFVYSENDVFNIVTHYGYESNIEFGRNEQVETISVGDRIPFQIVPAGRRLFIRAMFTNAHTNMTVVTNKHAYQFDLVSIPTPAMPNEELAYVVRFFYPGDRKNTLPPVYTDDVRGGPVSAAPAPFSGGSAPNYNYTFTGSDSGAPVKIFDDGSVTYFKFASESISPHIYAVSPGGKETSLNAHRSEGYWVVDAVAPRFTLRQGDAVVCVYNEKLTHP